MLWRTPTVIGHRGTGRGTNEWGEYENTPAAMWRVFQLGARWAETDAQLSRDGVLVDFHDLVLPDGRLINDLTVEELIEADVHTLAAVVDGMPVDFGFDLEAKAGPSDLPGGGPRADTADALADFVRARIHERPLCASSFDPGMAARLVAAGVPTGLLGRAGWPWRETVWAANRLSCAFAIGEAPGVLGAPGAREVAAWAAERQLQLAVWDATAETTAALLDIGIVGLCTDDAVGVAAALDAKPN
jgi:glycerophosphoryl diester phosphodiesterase